MALISQFSTGKSFLRLLKLSKSVSPLVCARSGSYWNHDWKPGQYPRTQEERARAAKRYGLLPEDYRPFPDDGNAPGDYPDLPAYSAHHRDHFEHFEDRQFVRHYNEPVHYRANLYRLGFADPNDQDKWLWRVPYWKQFLYLVLTLSGLWYTIVVLGNKYKYFTPVMAKQFPYDKKGQKHYLFEPAE